MFTRREFLRYCGQISLALCGTTLAGRRLAEGFIQLAQGPPQVAFIQGQNCLGCTTSLTYGNDFDFVDFFEKIIRLQVHPALSFTQGKDYLEELDRLAESGDFLLVVEGSIPAVTREACYLGPTPLYDRLADYARRARGVICSGTCASHGGIPGSKPEETGAISVTSYLLRHKIDVPMLQLPGCPVHPDHLMGSLAWFAATNRFPEAQEGRPLAYFKERIHTRCGRFQYFTQDLFVHDYEQEKDACLLKKGCRGPLTYSDCPTRRWNGRTSVCIESNTPCIGCRHSRWPFSERLYLEPEEFTDASWSTARERRDPK